MADILNKFYVNIWKTVEEKIPKGNKMFLHYLSDRNAYNIVLNPCTIEEIKNIYFRYESIEGHWSQKYTNEFAKTIHWWIDWTASDIFPYIIKFTSVCPIYKKSDRTKCANYRPISLLSNLSKIFEKAMYNRIELFLSEFDIIYKLQWNMLSWVLLKKSEGI